MASKKSVVYSIRIPIESRAFRWLQSLEGRGENVSDALRELINQYLASYGEDGYARLGALSRSHERFKAFQEYLVKLNAYYLLEDFDDKFYS